MWSRKTVLACSQVDKDNGAMAMRSKSSVIQMESLDELYPIVVLQRKQDLNCGELAGQRGERRLFKQQDVQAAAWLLVTISSKIKDEIY